MAEAAGTQTGRGRRWLWPVGAVLLVLLLVLAAAWMRLYLAPMSLPGALQSRIEARIDRAMVLGDIAIGDMVLALPEGGRAPALEFRDVALTDPAGDVRAALPALRVRVAPGPLIGGQMRVKRVVISGAGLNLRRGADGRFDLDFAGGEAGAADLSLADTLARLDAMFSAPVFGPLEEVRGENLEVVLSDDVTGRDMRLHGAEMRLTRDNGQLLLQLGGDLEGSRDAHLDIRLLRDADREVTEVALIFDTLAARDLAATTPALGWLDLVRAPIDGELTAELTDAGTLGAVTGVLELGDGQLSLPGGESPYGFDRMEAAFGYDPDTRRATVTRLRLGAEELSFLATGHADISPDGDTFTGQMQFSDIRAAPEGLFDAPVLIDGAAVDLRLTLGETVSVEIGQAAIHHGDLRAMVSGRIDVAPEGRTLALDAHLAEADLPTILSYWPAAAIPNTRWWVSERLRSAEATGIDFSIRAMPDAVPNYELSFDFEEAEIVALPAAPPITGASGYLNLLNQRLIVGVDAGDVAADGQGAVSIAGSRMVIGDVSVRGPLATFDLQIEGTVGDLLHVLNGPPFAVLAASGFTPEEIGVGLIRAEASLSTRLLDRPAGGGIADLGINASAAITSFEATELVPERVLRADRLQLTMTPEELAIGGPATLDNVPLTGQWSVLLDPDAPPGSIVRARATLSRDGLAEFGVALPDWLMSGSGEADVIARLQRGRPVVLDVSSDLDGVSLAIPPLAWSMGAGRTGDLRAEIRLGPQPEVTSLSLEGGGLTLNGSVSFTADGWLDRLSASRFRVGQWLDVRGALVGRRNLTPGIEVAGGVLDFRTMPSLAGSGGSSGDVGPLDIALNTMQITEGISLTDLRADLDGATMSGNFRGLVNGGAQVNGQLVPSPNGPSVRLQSSDGGAVMRAAQIFENMHGGQLDLILAARPEPGQYDGRLTVEGPRLRNAPVMAELLNVISVVGLLEQLSGEGINMGEVVARFRITPQRIFLEEGTAVGPSMGISMDGVYDVASERYEMQGVISPLYLVNGVMGALFATRREGLFGFSYVLSGDSGGTRVNVNPLSILTPGIFREIFRAPPPDFGDGGGG